MYFRFLYRLSCLVTALAAINIGLSPSGHNVCANQSFIGTCGQYMTYGSYFIGICGAYSLLHLMYKMFFCKACCKCGVMNCNCGKMQGNCSR